MPPRRTRAPTRPVTIHLDDAKLVADADASLASALVGAGDMLLARSPKFHRPRGPSCFRGGCDGCLMRVDGAPNVMTCMQRAAEGARVERQNVILTAKVDILRAADWFFPRGMNHHEMFAGVPGVQQVMQAFARRVSGLGELPDAPAEPAPPMRTVETDVLVVGGGPFGMAAAGALRRAGLRALLCDDRLALGGALLCLPPGAAFDGRPVEQTLEELGRDLSDVLVEATVLGVLEGDDWIIAARDGLVRVRARAHVIATGGHDPTPLFPGNDLPGVLSARAAGRLLRDGVLCGDQIVVDGDGLHARAFAAAAREHGAKVEVVSGVTSARGMSRVRSATIGARRVDCDAVVFDGPPAPSFEVAVQAGGAVRHRPAGYAVLTEHDGRVVIDPDLHEGKPSPRLFAVGEVCGAPLAAGALREAARLLAGALPGALP